ncbi:MAG TPA: hybrid sensor histidine kinase/response regulator [Chitinophaga sp.]|uniref:ATP-binding response regulator n=1 Tax=Chitinophaga sp. TaxID=1869181 RepID=UPI002C3A460C|nr:hybrid sensor histidine kinase/response regulator [Chitinophaga sp.]HVI46033.1 hybrid sensor histidine kinase/response regulator [Chitinophaga sp.]
MIRNILSIGITDGITQADDKNRLMRVNATAATLIPISLFFGFYYSFLTGKTLFAIATVIESIFFLASIILNYRGKYEQASLTLQLTINVAIIFFGSLLGEVIEPLWLTLFLTSGLFFQKGGANQKICIGLSIITLFLLEANKIYQVIPIMTFPSTIKSIIYYTASGTILFLSVFIQFFFIAQNRRLIKDITDINENLEETVRQRTQELNYTMLAHSHFIRELTHEIRNPLNGIFAITQAKYLRLKELDDDCDLRDDEIRDEDESLYHSCYNLLNILNNIQDSFKFSSGIKDAPSRDIVRVRDWIGDIINLYSFFAREKNVMIHLSMCEFPLIITDKIMVTKVINNILINAIKFTKKNTIVKIEIGRDNEYWNVVIIDQGPGIPVERTGTIFKEFYRTKTEFDGTGLGLSIAKRIAMALKGDIGVTSIVGVGTQFRIIFPFEEVETEAEIIAFQEQEEKKINRKITAAQRPKRTILLIDDDTLSLNFVARLISSNAQEYTVLTANNAADGIKTATLKQPHVILLDSHMPGISGREIVKQLSKSQSTEDIPVIIISGDSDRESKIAYYELGVIDYIVKPVEFHLIIPILDDLFNSKSVKFS